MTSYGDKLAEEKNRRREEGKEGEGNFRNLPPSRACTAYRDSLNCAGEAARIVYLLFLTFRAWPCLGLAQQYFANHLRTSVYVDQRERAYSPSALTRSAALALLGHVSFEALRDGRALSILGRISHRGRSGGKCC